MLEYDCIVTSDYCCSWHYVSAARPCTDFSGVHMWCVRACTFAWNSSTTMKQNKFTYTPTTRLDTHTYTRADLLPEDYDQWGSPTLYVCTNRPRTTIIYVIVLKWIPQRWLMADRNKKYIWSLIVARKIQFVWFGKNLFYGKISNILYFIWNTLVHGVVLVDRNTNVLEGELEHWKNTLKKNRLTISRTKTKFL